MAREHNRLSARTVAALSRRGRHADGGGLYLFATKGGEALWRRWIFRFTWQGRVREMGLGSASTVSLAEARRLAGSARRDVASGRNPIDAREAAKKAGQGRKTFGQCAVELIAAKASEWRNAKHRAQWHMTLATFARPLWDMPIDEVDSRAVLAVLQPCWRATPETASRLRGRIEAVLDAARAKGHIARNEANPARWKGHLDKLLPKRQKLSRGSWRIGRDRHNARAGIVLRRGCERGKGVRRNGSEFVRVGKPVHDSPPRLRPSIRARRRAALACGTPST